MKSWEKKRATDPWLVVCEQCLLPECIRGSSLYLASAKGKLKGCLIFEGYKRKWKPEETLNRIDEIQKGIRMKVEVSLINPGRFKLKYLSTSMSINTKELDGLIKDLEEIQQKLSLSDQAVEEQKKLDEWLGVGGFK